MIGNSDIRLDKSSREDPFELTEDEDEASSVVSNEEHEKIDDDPFEIVEAPSKDS